MRQSRRRFVSRAGRRIFARLGYTLCLWGACCLSLAVGVGPVLAQICVPPPAGILVWWPGDANGNNISSNANHAQLQNGATAGVSGKVSGAFQFDGGNDIAQTPVILPPQGTLELWVNPASVGDAIHGIIGTHGLNNGKDRLWIGIGFGGDLNTLVVTLGSCCATDFIIPSPFEIGSWTHVAFSFEFPNHSHVLYVNGQSVASSTATRNAPRSP